MDAEVVAPLPSLDALWRHKGTFSIILNVFKSAQRETNGSTIVVLAFVQVSDGRGSILERDPEGEALLLTFSICKFIRLKEDVAFTFCVDSFQSNTLAALSHSNFKHINTLPVLIDEEHACFKLVTNEMIILLLVRVKEV